MGRASTQLCRTNVFNSHHHEECIPPSTDLEGTVLRDRAEEGHPAGAEHPKSGMVFRAASRRASRLVAPPGLSRGSRGTTVAHYCWRYTPLLSITRLNATMNSNWEETAVTRYGEGRHAGVLVRDDGDRPDRRFQWKNRDPPPCQPSPIVIADETYC